MIEALIDHLWQSSLFALAAVLVTLAVRQNAASIRFRIWLAASLKFLLPLPLLVYIGRQFHWDTAPAVHATSGLSFMMDQVAEPGALVTTIFATPLERHATAHWAASHWSAWTVVLVVWSLGFLVLIGRWVFEFGKLRALVQASVPLDIEAPIPVHETATVLEPGIVGVIAPVLLLPAGILTQLTAGQFAAILEHELCHWRRRDNLTAALHMLVEAVFWFYPLVWWLGGRMIVERERACDEAVIRSGSDRGVYAEGILKVCQLYLEPPLLCAAGVSGGTLRKRVEEIMTIQVLPRLHFAKKCLLAATGSAAIVGPLAIGLAIEPRDVAQARELAADSAPMPSLPASSGTDMKHYQNSQWNFALDIPKRWNEFPPVLTNSPFEVVRFASHEDGNHLLIVFRAPYDPKLSPTDFAGRVEQVLGESGFSNFVIGATTIGSRHVVTLDFDRTEKNGSVSSCRQYYFVDGTIVYTLGFGTNRGDVMFGLYEQMAKTFAVTGPQDPS